MHEICKLPTKFRRAQYFKVIRQVASPYSFADDSQFFFAENRTKFVKKIFYRIRLVNMAHEFARWQHNVSL